MTEIYGLLNIGSMIRAEFDDPENKRIAVYSDSQYAINCVTGAWSPTKNVDHINKAQKYLKDLKCDYNWIRGHVGDYYNELADELAKRAANSQEVIEYEQSENVEIQSWG